MKPFRVLLVSLSLCAMPVLAGAVEPAAKAVAFQANVRVEVDASGKPVKVEAPADLPEAIRSYIEKRVASWQYQPAKQDGVAVPAMTYVQVVACAVPTKTGEYHLAADFDGNGPRNAGDARILPPNYPQLDEMRGYEAEFVLILDLATDGRASLAEIEKAEVSKHGRAKEFVQELRRWAKTLKFDPEQIAGRPVAGQIRMPVEFVLSDRSDWNAQRDEVRAKINASRECQMAQGESAMRPVVIDSVIKVTPIPAS